MPTGGQTWLSSRRRAAGFAFAAAIAIAAALPCLADPGADSRAAVLDPDYAAGKQALELNPRHRGAHEYIGEAYLMVRDLANAREHLAALESICLLPCEELSDLKDKIAAYKSGAR